MTFERITVIGHIGETVLLTSQAKKPYARISVAVDRSIGDRKVTTWYSVMLFGAMAVDQERIRALYTPGRLVLAEGRPQTEAFIKNNGTAGLDNTIVAITMPELLGARPASAGPPR